MKQFKIGTPVRVNEYSPKVLFHGKVGTIIARAKQIWKGNQGQADKIHYYFIVQFTDDWGYFGINEIERVRK